MSDVKCARAMFHAAERDLLALGGMTADVPEEAFGFHVQQAAEKSFKAWIALRGETYPLTYNLELLLDRLAAQGVATKPFQQLAKYTPYAVEFRYEGIGSDTEAIDREGVLALVKVLLGRVREEFPEAVSPSNRPPKTF